MLSELMVAPINKLNKKPKFMNIHIDDISINKYNNHKRVRNIEELAENIKENGLMKPLEVYEYGDDLYRLIGGERRYTALMQLYKDKLIDPEIPCLVYKVEQGVKERIQIHMSNAQEPMEEEDKIITTRDLLQCLEIDSTLKPVHMKTRDWIAPFIQCKSGKTAQKYINIVKGKAVSKSPEKNENVNYDYAKELAIKKLRTKVTIKNKKMCIYFTDIEDLNSILARMNLLEE